MAPVPLALHTPLEAVHSMLSVTHRKKRVAEPRRLPRAAWCLRRQQLRRGEVQRQHPRDGQAKGKGRRGHNRNGGRRSERGCQAGEAVGAKEGAVEGETQARRAGRPAGRQMVGIGGSEERGA